MADALTRDLRDWYDPTCVRPKLRLMGPVALEATGPAQPQRQRFYVGMCAYLALHRGHAVSPGDLASAVTSPDSARGNTATAVRPWVRNLRAWLGRDPQTGQWYLPLIHETGAYQLSEEVLVDVDLLYQLRARSERTNPSDLVSALGLVTGPLVPDVATDMAGWQWLKTHCTTMVGAALAITAMLPPAVDALIEAGRPDCAADLIERIRPATSDDLVITHCVAAVDAAWERWGRLS